MPSCGNIPRLNIEWIRKYCLSLPYATEQVQWEDNLVFKIGGRMFAVAQLEHRAVWLSFKCSVEDFAELIEKPQIIPAPYLARASWVALESPDALPTAEIKRLVRKSYKLIFSKLAKTTRLKLACKPRN
jgi:predicted DNA-binding protein (MmcQ/YjbR family)